MNNILNDYFTRVPNEFIKGDDFKLGIKELGVTTILLQNINVKNICSFNLAWLYETLNISDKNTYSQKEIKNIINGFIEDEIIICRNNISTKSETIEDVNTISKNKLIFAQINIDLNEETFTMITETEVDLIKKYCEENSVDMFGLLATCLYILSCINMNEKDEDYLLCYPSIENISSEVDISEKTVLKYINILKELKILVFDYAGYKILSDSKIKNGKMFYTRYDNEELLLNRLKKEREEHGFIDINKRLKNIDGIKIIIKNRINNLENKKELSILDKENLINYKKVYNNLKIESEIKIKNNYKSKYNKTQEEKDRERLYPEYKDFIEKVLIRDKYKCRYCGKEINLNVHHSDGYNWCKEKRTDETNGITLCKTCHKEFHSIYGYGNNTKEQFKEWINNKIEMLSNII